MESPQTREDVYDTRVTQSDDCSFQAELFRNGKPYAAVTVHSLSALLERSKQK